MTYTDKKRRLWGYYHGEDDPEAPPPIGPEPVAAFKFDEGVGTTSTDEMGGPAIDPVPGWSVGRHGSGLRFLNVNGPVVTPFAAPSPFTIMFDVMLQGVGGNNYNMLMNDWEHSGSFGNLQVPFDGFIDWYGGAPTETQLQFDLWKHLTMVANGVQRKIYVDGVLAGQINNATLLNGPIVLGGFNGYTPNMTMDNLRIYDVEVDAETISLLAGTSV